MDTLVSQNQQTNVLVNQQTETLASQTQQEALADQSQQAEMQKRLCQIPLWATLVSYIVGFLWVTCLAQPYDWMPQHGMITLFTAVFFLWAEFAFKNIARPSKECWFWMVCALAIAIGIDIPREMIDYKADLIENHPMLDGWNYIALHIIAIYWILCRSGKLTDNKTGSMIVLDGIAGSFLAPISGMSHRIKRIIYGIKEISSAKNIGITILSVVIVLPVLALVIHLLCKADTSFSSLFHNILSSFAFDAETFARLIFGIIVSSYFFSILSNSVVREKPVFSGQNVRDSLETLRFLPTSSSAVIFGIFIATYLFFFGVQGSNQISAFWGEIPGTLTAANFAKSGFSELCVVMGINFGLILASAILSKTPQHPILRTMKQILLSESILLALTAASKLILYIERFGFTTRRLLGIWAILILTCGCILAILAIRKNKSYFDKWIWFSVATFVPLCFF